MTARQAVAPAAPDAPPTLFQFSAACWYFAEALTLKMKEVRVDMRNFDLVFVQFWGHFPRVCKLHPHPTRAV